MEQPVLKTKRSAPREEAESLARAIMDEAAEYDLISRYALVGSCRRKADIVNDVDIVVQPINYFAVEKWLAQMFGRKSNRQARTTGIIEGIQFDIYVAGYHEWGTHLFTLTGSHKFYRRARDRAKELGRRLDRHGLWQGGTRIAGEKEKEVFLALGLSYVPPAER